MRSIPSLRSVAIRLSIILIAPVVFMAACSSSDSGQSGADATATSIAIPDLSFAGDLEPKTRIGRPANDQIASTLELVESGDHGSFSRVTFFFLQTIPNYSLQYVETPIACGSGEPLDIEGEAFLELRLTPATGHGLQGETSYVVRPEDAAGELPAVVDLQPSCDFEGELTWVFGLPEPLDFSISFLGAPLSREVILVDIKNPE